MLKNNQMSFFARALVSLVKGYQYLVSPLLGSNCRYFPSCSSYTLEAIKLHGAAKGLVMGSWRILRCNPFSKGGYEPVPGSCEHRQMSTEEPQSK